MSSAPTQSANISGDLAWWSAQAGRPDLDHAELARVLARLKAWKVRHDQDRAAQPVPFLKMAWDGVFGDEDTRVTRAIAEIEAGLAADSGG